MLWGPVSLNSPVLAGGGRWIAAALVVRALQSYKVQSEIAAIEGVVPCLIL